MNSLFRAAQPFQASSVSLARSLSHSLLESHEERERDGD
uniref:Uncharacterized protein n=1 Tax=Rhizophora mucronata TaxID=61149 RepID=A0A2P2JCY4_RHIMU